MSIYLQYQDMSYSLGYDTQTSFEISQISQDNREKLHAMELFKDTHLVKLELLSNATTIDSALNFIRNKQQDQQKGLSLDSMTTTNNQPTTGKQTIF